MPTSPRTIPERASRRVRERGAVFLPLVKRLDLSLTQDVFTNIGGERHRFQFRIDIINFGNLLNHNWGVCSACRTRR